MKKAKDFTEEEKAAIIKRLKRAKDFTDIEKAAILASLREALLGLQMLL